MFKPDRPLTLKQAADRLGVHPNTARNWVQAGRLDHFRTPGNHLRIPLAAVERITGPSPPTLS